MNEDRFAVRTIRKGCVRIHGKDYRPMENYQPYDGRLDGLRYAFGLYRQPEGAPPFKSVSLWGTEARFRHAGGDETPWGPEQMEDGTLPWQWWDEAVPREEQR